jgi:hypothetical protein
VGRCSFDEVLAICISQCLAATVLGLFPPLKASCQRSRLVMSATWKLGAAAVSHPAVSKASERAPFCRPGVFKTDGVGLIISLDSYPKIADVLLKMR